MNTKLFLTELFEYNDYANRLFLPVLMYERNIPEKAQLIFSHILNAHSLWLDRISGNEYRYGVWQLHKAIDLEEIHFKNHNDTIELLDKEIFEQKITYTNSQGNSYENRIDEILIHVTNHSTYHRGQVATIIKQAGITPPVTDYIAYKR
jgi:uncharacterized damage-inducible protein DinB